MDRTIARGQVGALGSGWDKAGKGTDRRNEVVKGMGGHREEGGRNEGSGKGKEGRGHPCPYACITATLPALRRQRAVTPPQLPRLRRLRRLHCEKNTPRFPATWYSMICNVLNINTLQIVTEVSFTFVKNKTTFVVMMLASINH